MGTGSRRRGRPVDWNQLTSDIPFYGPCYGHCPVRASQPMVAVAVTITYPINRRNVDIRRSQQFTTSPRQPQPWMGQTHLCNVFRQHGLRDES